METREILNPKTITKKCVFCGKDVILTVDELDYMKYEGGMYVQDCFPYLSAGEREMFISGVCPECFEETFGKEEEDEGNEGCNRDCNNCESRNESDDFRDPGYFELGPNKTNVLKTLGYDLEFIENIANAMAEFFPTMPEFPKIASYNVFREFIKTEKFKALAGDITPNKAFALGYFKDAISDVVAKKNMKALSKAFSGDSAAIVEQIPDQLFGGKSDGK